MYVMGWWLRWSCSVLEIWSRWSKLKLIWHPQQKKWYFQVSPIFLKSIIPHLCQSHRIPLHNVSLRRPLVRRSLPTNWNKLPKKQESIWLKITENSCPPKNVANMRAGDNLESSPAHPRLKAELQVLSAPDVKPEKIKHNRYDKKIIKRCKFWHCQTWKDKKVKIVTKKLREKKCQPRVVSAEFLKEGPVNGKKPAWEKEY